MTTFAQGRENASAIPAIVIQSTVSTPWQQSTIAGSSARAAPPPDIILDAALPAQVIDGFGGCFNEKGWEVLGLLPDRERESVLRALFDPATGCGFNLGRLPMGANDYSLHWHSFDEIPDDYALAHFSIARDRRLLIPYVKAALRLNPYLTLWASPWCPPSWMKTNRHYAGAPAPVNDLRPDQAGQEMITQFRMEPAVLAAYARYFGKFLDAYAAEGLRIDAVHVQNEPNSAQNFPSCVWRPEDLGTFIGRYLGPRFRSEGRATQIWLGTIERPQPERVTSILDSPAGAFVAGVGLQWAGRGAIAEIHRRYPALKLMQTESECGDGSNDWAALEHTWDLMRHYFEHGAGAYLYWNLVLDETGNSRWGWRQNALITVERASRAVRYNPEFYLMRHLAAFIPRGSRCLALRAPADALGFLTPAGEAVLVLAQRADCEKMVTIRRADVSWTISLPPRSLTTLVLPASSSRPKASDTASVHRSVPHRRARSMHHPDRSPPSR